MQNNFDQSMVYVFVSEGGYTNHPNDPGGPTNWGITQANLGAWLGHKASVAEVKALAKDEAKKIYKHDYWDACKCDELQSGIDYLMFDFGVNAGNSRAVKTLQKVLGLPMDGAFGAATLAAVLAMDGLALINDYTTAKLAFYRSISTTKPSLAVFLKGWTSRCADVKKHAMAMHNAQAPIEYVHSGEPNAKAMVLPDKVVGMNPALDGAVFVEEA
jgi:lysozyme family protein